MRFADRFVDTTGLYSAIQKKVFVVFMEEIFRIAVLTFYRRNVIRFI